MLTEQLPAMGLVLVPALLGGMQAEGEAVDVLS